MSAKTTARELHEGWAFAKVGGREVTEVRDGEWLPAQSFPTTVHVELLGHKRIPDPVRAALVSVHGRGVADFELTVRGAARVGRSVCDSI